MTSEITEVWDYEKTSFIRDKESERDRIRRLIKYQKSLLCGPSPSCVSYSPTSSQSHVPSSYSSFSNPRSHGRASLRQLMKLGGGETTTTTATTTSLRTLFHLEYQTDLSAANPGSNFDVDNFGLPASVEESDVESDGCHEKEETKIVEQGRRNILGKKNFPSDVA